MLPGGPAAKLGNRYETWCAVAELLRLLHGETDTLRIEVPGIDKADFVVSTGTHRAAHQVKRSHHDGKWSFAELRAEGLISYIGEFLADGNNRFVFTSGSEARELHDLERAAKDAESIDEFTAKFVGETKRKKRFETLVSDWSCDPQSAVERLRRLDVRTVDERELRDKVRWAARALFIANPDGVITKLRAIADGSVHRTITRHWLTEELAESAYWMRRVRNPRNAGLVVHEATNRYLDVARRRLIQHELVPRSASETLLSRLDATASDSVVTGKAWGGKTACVVEVAEGLRERGRPVLAFRLDRIPPSVHTTTGLGLHLGLEESPVLVLAAAAEWTGRPGVLIVDQLDAVSTMSGQSSAAFDLVEGLIEEVRGMRARTTLHTVVVCRSFDWQRDPRLRRLLPNDHDDRIDVTDFQSDEVAPILTRAGFDPALFRARQLELLRLPQNLSLFLEAGFDPSIAPPFHTATKLFDRYWENKRSTVAEIVGTDDWMAVMEALCGDMNAEQRISVPRERLDGIPSAYVRQLASEGVLTSDGHRYGFGHESFFDYCFARMFVNRRDPITSFLKSSEQHLFRRAQVRQVLAYLRDADFCRYLRELEDMLSDPGIRTHIKDLAFALLAEVADPTDEEWAFWKRWTAAALQAVPDGTRTPDKLSLLAWRWFFGSTSWFADADGRGMIQDWLASGNDRLADMAVNYLWAHHAHAPDRVAALLRPYADRGNTWPKRLRSLMEKTEHHTSRPYFDLLLHLVDNGTMDVVGRDIVKNNTIWSMLYGVGEHRPEWIPQAVVHILRRRCAVIRMAGKDLDESRLIGFDDTAARLVQECASRAPSPFVRHVLPLVLDLSDSTAFAEEPPKCDSIWGMLFKTEHPKGEDACLFALSEALKQLVNDDSEDLRSVISELRRRATYVANYLLQSLYAGAPGSFADEAVLLLCEQPWRFRCGYSDSPHWSTMELIRTVIPHCTVQNRERIESLILNYVEPFERPTAEDRSAGFRYNEIGRTSFSLLSAFPTNLRSARANRYFGELERRFGTPDGPPRALKVRAVPSPIPEPDAAMMTDDQWLHAIMKHRQEEPQRSRPHSLRGGARQLSQVLGKLAKEDPHRFARLSLTFPADANPVYLERTLDALRDGECETVLKLQVCRKAYADSRESCGTLIADVLGSVEEPLPKDAVEMLDWLATEHEDPDKELWQQEADRGQRYHNGDIYTNGINTTRGRAAEAIQRLILADASYIQRLRPTIDRILGDPSAAVRSCVAGVLRGIAVYDSALGMTLFRSLNLSEDRLLATVHVSEFIRSHLQDAFPELRPIVERMFRSAEPEVCEVGAALASLAAMVHESAADLGDEALQGAPRQRRGVAQVVAANVAAPGFRDWCQARLVILFDDDDDEVRQATTDCFSRLPEEALEAYGDLIQAFCDSRAFAGGAFWLTRALEKSRGRLPGMTCMVCERSLDHPSTEAFETAKLVFRTYQQHQDDEWASHTLDLIDRLCLEGNPSLGSEFEEFDR
ncbi:MAG: hypothetical protein OXJ90_03575 [Spirochaetaceae bacterium]|nr:hypothetical protein [Spirochaetaceae bacterium]